VARLPRDEVVVETKVGRLLRDVPYTDSVRFYHGTPDVNPVFDFSSDGVLRSVAESLERLGLDRVDVLHIHDPDEHGDEALSGAFAALERLRDEGAIGAIGAGMNQSAMLADLVRETDIDVVMLAGRYTLADQGALDDLLPLCSERRVAVVAAGVFNSGLLARAHPAGDSRYDYGDAPREVVARAQAMARICERHGTTLPAAALAFPLAHPAVASVCVGARTPAQVQRNAALGNEAISPDLWSELKAERLVRDDAPVPGQPRADEAARASARGCPGLPTSDE
jgi:D-threo-aldose 1-dehydrogenase